MADVNATLDFVHASPRRPINEYVFPDDVYTTTGKMSALFERVKHICFVGHTHLPGVFLEDPDFYTPDELGGAYPIIADEKAIINGGSVGQPRDRDNRTSYVYIQDNNVNFVRLEYDFKAAAKKIYNRLENFDILQEWSFPAKFDLIYSSDVFVYFGNLETIVRSASSSLVSGGVIAFSVERLDDNSM